ncbi:glycosyltransferase [Photobacterium damselae]
MRILHVIATRPQGGIATFLKNMLLRSEPSITYDFLIGDNIKDSKFDNFIKEHGSQITVINSLNKPIQYIKDLNVFFENLPNKHYDIIHIHSPLVFLFNWYYIKKYTTSIIASHSHSTKYSDSIIGKVRNFPFYCTVKYLSQARFSCSLDASKFLYGNKGSVIIKNGIEVDKYKFCENSRNDFRNKLLVVDKFVIGQVGAFFDVKNHAFMINLLKEIREYNYEFFSKIVLIFVGDGPNENKIKKLVKKYNLANNVIFVGRSDEVCKYYMAFDCFVMPSLFEGVPLAGIEAQATGLPCLFSTGISCDVNYNNAFFIDLNKTKEWIFRLEDIYINANIDRPNAYKAIISQGGDFSSSVKILNDAYKKTIEMKKDL